MVTTSSQVDFGKGQPLFGTNRPQADELEGSDDEDDNLLGIGVPGEVARERHEVIVGDVSIDLPHLVLNVVPQGKYLNGRRMGSGEFLHDSKVGLRQKLEVDFFPVEIDLFIIELGDDPCRPDALPYEILVVQDHGQFLDPPKGQKSLDQFLSGISLFCFGAWKQHFRLELQEPRRHPEKLAGHIEVELLHGADVLVVLIADVEDGDIVDRDLVLADEVQQQVERPTEKGQLNGWSQGDEIDEIGIHFHNLEYNRPPLDGVVTIDVK